MHRSMKNRSRCYHRWVSSTAIAMPPNSSSHVWLGSACTAVAEIASVGSGADSRGAAPASPVERAGLASQVDRGSQRRDPNQYQPGLASPSIGPVEVPAAAVRVATVRTATVRTATVRTATVRATAPAVAARATTAPQAIAARPTADPVIQGRAAEAPAFLPLQPFPPSAWDQEMAPVQSVTRCQCPNRRAYC